MGTLKRAVTLLVIVFIVFTAWCLCCKYPEKIDVALDKVFSENRNPMQSVLEARIFVQVLKPDKIIADVGRKKIIFYESVCPAYVISWSKQSDDIQPEIHIEKNEENGYTMILPEEIAFRIVINGKEYFFPAGKARNI